MSICRGCATAMARTCTSAQWLTAPAAQLSSLHITVTASLYTLQSHALCGSFRAQHYPSNMASSSPFFVYKSDEIFASGMLPNMRGFVLSAAPVYGGPLPSVGTYQPVMLSFLYTLGGGAPTPASSPAPVPKDPRLRPHPPALPGLPAMKMLPAEVKERRCACKKE